MAPYAVSGGKVDRPRESRPPAKSGERHHSGRTRRRSTHGSRSRSRPAAAAAAMDSATASTDTTPRRDHSRSQAKYQPLRPTIRTVSPDGGGQRPQRQKSRGRGNGDARTAALDGGGDSPGARLMGNSHGDGLERDPARNTRRKKSSAAAAAGAAAAAAAASASASAAPSRHRSQRSGSRYKSRGGGGGGGGGGGEKGRGKGKRPFSADSDDFVAPQRKRRCGRCFCMGVSRVSI